MTSWSGLWNRHYGEAYSALGSNNTEEANGTQKRKLARMFRARGNRPLAKLIEALTGAAVGGSASATYTQIPAHTTIGVAVSGGGLITPAAVTDLDRVTVTADATLVDGILEEKTYPATYPVDLSGNGGATPGHGNF
jgi:hypothetical protein